MTLAWDVTALAISYGQNACCSHTALMSRLLAEPVENWASRARASPSCSFVLL
jgi:hypothetical protein